MKVPVTSSRRVMSMSELEEQVASFLSSVFNAWPSPQK
jgi:hypothetical protein